MPSEFHTTRRIEFSDTDMAGIVHFSRFFVFMEAAEHAFLRSLGTSVAGALDGRSVGWPRVGASCDYLNPARFEDRLDVRLTVMRKGTRSMTYGFEFRRGEVLIARGRLSTVFCECAPGQPFRSIPIPGSIADQISESSEEEGGDDAEG
ncbi:MAG: thioesterase family protein [Gemmatimonadota bacterium]|nr:thioesterase family protein [Gemmatimonadota bacterium]